MSTHHAGDLRHRLRLEAPVRTPGDGGTAAITFTLVEEVAAAITDRAGREIVAADGVAGRVSHQIVIRQRPGVLPAMRFAGDGRVYEIKAVLDPDGRRQWLECLCEEKLP